MSLTYDCQTHGQWHPAAWSPEAAKACPQCFAALRVDVERLTAENKALREALRKRQIEPLYGTSRGICNECGMRWATKKERHAADCLCAPREGE